MLIPGYVQLISASRKVARAILILTVLTYFYFVSLAYVPRFISYKLYKLDKLYFILYETLVTICLCQMSVGIHSNLQGTPRRKEHLGDLGRSWEYKTVFNHKSVVQIFVNNVK